MLGAFFQDDWYHLFQINDKSFFQMLKYFNLWQKGSLDPYQYYRPLSSKLYFFLSHHLFGLRPPLYLLVNVCLFILNILLFYKIVKKTLVKKQAIYSIFFYTFSLANFTYISYISTVDNLVFGIFALATILLWIKKKKTISIAMLLFALMSRESALIIPLILLLYQTLINRDKLNQALKSLIPWFSILAIYFFSRTFIYGWPKLEKAYHISILGTHPFANMAKYLQWNLNITGLIKQASIAAYLSFLSLILLLRLSILSIKQILKQKSSLKLFVFGKLWWLVFSARFCFFLTIAILGTY
jgi:hypothetical protein